MHQKRLTIRKLSSAGGAFSVQTTMDASFNLPVTIQVKNGLTGGSPMDVFWAAAWGRPRSGTMPLKDFQIPNIRKKSAK